MTQGEIDATTADPFCGFNLGSTVFRATPEKERQPRKFVFESPVIRLASDFQYKDVYEDGYDILDREWSEDKDRKLSTRSIIIFRYYDEASKLLGDGETPSIREFATKLGKLIGEVRKLICANPENGVTEDTFRYYLVGHSMGGLVCRTFLQNPDIDPEKLGSKADKFFTYATPHNGIDLAGFNIPSWLSKSDINNFSREVMAEYLNLKHEFKKTQRVDWIPESAISPERVFCMIGTNRSDYEAGLGLSRAFAGHGSDGLVRIENATLCSIKKDGSPGVACAKAFAYRSHSGYFGIVNSEESYQNLARFLFGDLRVDVWVDVEAIRLPEHIQKEEDEGKTVNAIYQFEVQAGPRGKLWYLTRRTAEEDSVACLTHQDWIASGKQVKSLFLSTVFLALRSRVDPTNPSMSYSLTLGVRVPDYEVERRLRLDKHYEGSYLFRNSIVLEIEPPSQPNDGWVVKYAWQDKGVQLTTKKVKAQPLADGKIEVLIPHFETKTSPGIRGQLRFVVSRWNPDAKKEDGPHTPSWLDSPK